LASGSFSRIQASFGLGGRVDVLAGQAGLKHVCRVAACDEIEAVVPVMHAVFIVSGMVGSIPLLLQVPVVCEE
jgi:hypothetical protein